MQDECFFSKIDRIKSRLYRIAFGYLGNEGAAVDAVDEAIFKGYKGRNHLRELDFFDTWMTRILMNECNRVLRHRKREVSLAELPDTETEWMDNLPLKEAIRCLPDQLRSIVVLRYFGGLTLAETAERLGIPQGTAATRQRRALTLLKLDLGEEEVL